MNSTPKADPISILMSGVSVHTEVQVGDIMTCVLIDRYALIQTLGKSHGCQTLGDYAEVFIRNVTHQFGEHKMRIDVVFDRHIGDESIKTATRSKRVGTRKPIRKTIDGTDNPRFQVWSSFIVLEENKADLARFLSGEIMQKRCRPSS